MAFPNRLCPSSPTVIFLGVERDSPMMEMCRDIIYRRKGSRYTCIRKAGDGREEILFTGTPGEIREALVAAGYPPISPELFLENLEEWVAGSGD